METIQDRSALIREMEERGRKGYEFAREAPGELSGWESEAAWPAD